MKVLFVTPEAFPLVKVGGLADVSYALPKALRTLGVDVRILLPGYPQVLDKVTLSDTGVSLTLFKQIPPARLRRGVLADSEVPLYVLDAPGLYQRAGNPYTDAEGKDWPDNELRFAALSKAAALLSTPTLGGALNFIPDLVHCNDWPTGLTPAFLRRQKNRQATRSLMTIHNMAHQGIFPPDTVSRLGLPWEDFHMNGLEYYGQLSFMKAGLYYADWINTVSPTYAEEIQSPDFGYGLYGLLQSRRERLSGILNGIDPRHWNPERDTYLKFNYNARQLDGKYKNQKQVRKKLGLNPRPDKPLLIWIGRVAAQKGLDLVLPLIERIMLEGAQLAILGSGDKTLERALQAKAEKFPGKFSFTCGYDEALSHQLVAAGDVLLMPSHFEPCGLLQMYAMNYGTLPLVRHTGGLADSVVDTTPASLAAQTATGFMFNQASSEALEQALLRALLLYRDQTTWRQVQRQAMQRNFAWRQSAEVYRDLYVAIMAETPIERG